MFQSPSVFFALYFSLAIVVGLPLGFGGCQVLLSQIGSPLNGASLETTVSWKERYLARPWLDVEVRNADDVVVTAVSVTCEFQDAMGIPILRSRAFLPQALHAGETQHLYASSFESLPRFERARCSAEGV